MDEQKPKPIRRERYKGTHPKSFKEKYKELQPGQYSDDVAKVIQQGRTPAGMHRPICVKEILEILEPAPGQKGLDATLGYGGHSVEMLQRIIPGGHLYALDVDPIESAKTRSRLEALGYSSDVITIKGMNFSEVDRIIAESGPLNFILADLGVSSMQIDNPERGFSYKVNGPLDLRLNPTSGISAAELLWSVSQDELEAILFGNADEPFYELIAKAICSSISKGKKIKTTIDLQEVIKDTLKYLPENIRKEETKKSCQRCFQALRIEVNNEFESLDLFLEKIPEALIESGRVAILSFHSGEDRRVKKSFQAFQRAGIYKDVAPDPIRPSSEECHTNPRAKSAKLRWAIKA